jgi:hypothetical protein
MLLSVERPFVGASAVRIPGAALLHRNGLVPAVLPASTEHGKFTDTQQIHDLRNPML